MTCDITAFLLIILIESVCECVRRATLLNELDTEKNPVFESTREIKMLLYYELNLICSRSSVSRYVHFDLFFIFLGQQHSDRATGTRSSECQRTNC